MKRITHFWLESKGKNETKLLLSGYLESGKIVRETNNYFEIVENIDRHRKLGEKEKCYSQFLEFYENKISQANSHENIYLKRSLEIPINAQDIKSIYSPSYSSSVIQNYPSQFIECIEKIIKNDYEGPDSQIKSLLVEYLPTQQYIYSSDSESIRHFDFVQNSEIVIPAVNNENVSYKTYFHPLTGIRCICERGIVYRFFPDPVKACKIPVEFEIDSRHQKLLTEVSPEQYQEKKPQGYKQLKIKIATHKKWRMSKRVPDFYEIDSIADLSFDEIYGAGLLGTK